MSSVFSRFHIGIRPGLSDPKKSRFRQKEMAWRVGSLPVTWLTSRMLFSGFVPGREWCKKNFPHPFLNTGPVFSCKKREPDLYIIKLYSADGNYIGNPLPDRPGLGNIRRIRRILSVRVQPQKAKKCEGRCGISKASSRSRCLAGMHYGTGAS